ncbi:hypothetical protein B0T25DRAFT_287297 [Lasiosphaeria hispida]|uniref:Uncharacterized protein n=1 Tax=Lasiosphaeria hispida TaxID=260671 RepID=A0AAJ0HBY1_9PEZI|nr:hypothetical protein B0T25DRAFT_287297 [Lasiosphaeria hispida]
MGWTVGRYFLEARSSGSDSLLRVAKLFYLLLRPSFSRVMRITLWRCRGATLHMGANILINGFTSYDISQHDILRRMNKRWYQVDGSTYAQRFRLGSACCRWNMSHPLSLAAAVHARTHDEKRNQANKAIPAGRYIKTPLAWTSENQEGYPRLRLLVLPLVWRPAMPITLQETHSRRGTVYWLVQVRHGTGVPSKDKNEPYSFPGCLTSLTAPLVCFMFSISVQKLTTVSFSSFLNQGDSIPARLSLVSSVLFTLRLFLSSPSRYIRDTAS